MLTIKPIGSSREEINYYAHLGELEQHNSYYSEDGKRPGVWWGEGAKALGLEGEVEAVTFQNLLEGKSPDGTKSLVQIRNGQQLKRRCGFDLTFSEVKSFDAAWSLANSERRAELEKVAEESLYRALEVVQDLCGVTRRGKDGAITEDAKLIGAVFHHDTARGVPGEMPDPKKHHHVVIANIVVREDGTTGALDARPIFQRRMKMAIGALFRAELSMRLERELGIATYRPKHERRDERVSWFELQGVPPELMREMSKRRVQIEKWLRQHGLSGTKASQKAALGTRQKKEHYTWQELKSAWVKMGREFDFSEEQVEALFERLVGVEVSVRKESQAAIQRAIARLTEQKARFTFNELLERTAIEAQAHGIGIDAVLEVVEHAIEQDEELVRLEDAQGVKAYTTKTMLKLEETLLQRARRLEQRNTHIVGSERINEVIRQHKTLRPDQAKVLRAIAGKGDMVAITGVAGSGKTFTLSVVNDLLSEAGYQVLGTSLASKASKGLEKESGIFSLHIHKLLYEIEQQKIEVNERTVLIVDEAGMVGTVQMEKLTRISEDSGAKCVLVGDHHQLQAIAAGAPLRSIGETIGATEMKTIIRQREPWAREVVMNFRDGKAEIALAELYERGQLIITEERDEAMDRLILNWKELVIEKRSPIRETIVFSGMNADMRELNRRIQEVLVAEGQLGEYAVEVDGLEVRLGDCVMITKNHHMLNLRNGTMAEVVGVEGESVWLLTEDGFEVEIDTKVFDHFTLSYAMSVTKGQGVTCENALIFTDNVMVDREYAYVSGSRARAKTHFYTDQFSIGGIEELADRMNLSRPKEMAIEHRLELRS